MNSELIHVVGRPHPLRTSRIESFVVAGQTLEQIVTNGLTDLNVPACMWGHGHAYVGETYVPREQWAFVIPQPGTMVTYRIVPQGGGSKNPVKALLSLVVVAVAAWAGPLLAGSLFMGSAAISVAGAAFTMGLTALGMLAVNSLIPMKINTGANVKDTEKDSDTYSLSGSTNQINKFGAIPVLLGRHRITPPQAALPYTEIAGDDQYVMQLFCLGYTGISIESTIRVGETNVSEYDEFNYQLINGAVEGTQPVYYQNDIYETTLSIELKSADGWTTRTTEQAGHQFSIDVVAAQGLRSYNASNGSMESQSVTIEVMWRVSGTGGWSSLPSQTYTGRQTKALRRNISSGTISSTPQFFDVSVRRLTPDSSSDRVVDVFHWSTLRSVNYRSPIGKVKPVDLISIRVKATGELNGTIDELNFDAVSVCPDWDYGTSTWITKGTNNPASLYRYVLQHPANAKPKPDSAIDLEKLQEWHDFCRLKGLSYNRYFDFRSSVVDVLKEVAAAGLASIDHSDGEMWSVVIEQPRDSIRQLFTPRNSWNFKSTRAYPEMPHGWRVMFNNENEGYQPDEIIVYADGYGESNADLFEGIEFPGVTDPEQIIKLGRQHYADALLCREEYSFEADHEHLVCTRGDRVKCAHPVTMWGLAQGRVKSSDVDEQVVVVDEPCPMIAGKSYSIRWRDDENNQHIRSVVTGEGDQTELSLSDSGSLPVKGDIFAFGETNEETVDLIVKGIVDRGEYLSARLICKDYVPAVFDAVDKVLPPYITHITQSYPIIPVPVPVITQVMSVATVISGQLSRGIQLGFTASDGDAAQIQYRAAGESTWRDTGRTDIAVGVVMVDGIEETPYELRVRTIKGLRTSTWVETTHEYSLEAAMTILIAAWSSSLSGFTASVQIAHINFSWVPQPNIASYEIRFGDSWETGTTIATGITTNTWAWQPTVSGTLKFFMKGTVIPGWNTIETATTYLSVTPPSVSNFISKVIGNHILLSWENVVGSYAIETVEISVGLDYSSATIVGNISGTFSSIFESTANTYKYWATPIDRARLRGEPIGIYVVVSEPPGYIFLSKTYLKWDGAMTNMLIDGGLVYGLVNTTETFEQHFIDNGFVSPQAQIDAGFPYFLQPGTSTATYSETIDHGAVISSSSITIAITRSTLVGTVTVTPTISYSENGTDWVSGPEGSYRVYGFDFRYTKIELVISTVDNGIVVITDGTVTLDAQQKEFSGSVNALASDVDGTVVAVEGFIDIQDITLNAVGATPVLTACDYDDIGNPTSFVVFAFNPSGLTRVDSLIKYTIRGV